MFLFGQKWLCPFCCASFSPQESRFRCISPRCLGRTPDSIYSRVSGNKSVSMGRVLVPAKKRNLIMAEQGIRCDICSEFSTTRICPKCHCELPVDIGQVEQYFFLLVGGREAGKTHYLASLIAHLQREVGPRLKMTIRPLGEPAKVRWGKTYAPLFEQKKILPMTRSAEVDLTSRYPLSFRFTFEQENGTKRMVNIGFFDASGEDFHADSGAMKTYMQSTHGIIFLLDPLSMVSARKLLAKGNLNGLSPTAAAEGAIEEYPLLVRDFFEAERLVRSSEKVKVPIALTLSKMDVVLPHLDRGSSLLRPTTYSGGVSKKRLQSISTEVSSLLASWIGLQFNQTVRNEFDSYAYFGVSALGEQADDQNKLLAVTPLHVEDPLLWLFLQLHIVKDTKQ